MAKTVRNLPAMQETWVKSLDGEDPLEEEMATHSSVLAWRILWTEEPGGLQSTGSQRRGCEGLPCWLSGKDSACNAGDPGSIPGSGRSPGEGNGYPLQYSCLEIPCREEPGGLPSMGVTKSQTQLNN